MFPLSFRAKSRNLVANLKNTAQGKVPSTGLRGRLRCAARRFGLAAQADVPWNGFWAMSRCAAIVGLGRLGGSAGSEGKWAAGEEQMVESGKVWLQNDGEGLQNGGKMWAGGAFCVDLEDLQK